jgi:hypothetical protein
MANGQALALAMLHLAESRLIPAAALLILLGCTHTDPFVSPPISTVGPFSTGPDVQLTFNVDQDYWPTWNGDGKGILYAYVDREYPLHRCLGMLSPAGGTRLWQLCDNRAVRDDSMSSFAAFAMDTAGQLLVAEAVSSIHEGPIALPLTSLWLADTAHPYVRTTLLTLPTTAGATPVSWLSDLAWTGRNTFVVLGQQFNTAPHCVTAPVPGTNYSATQCVTRDTLWADSGGVVLRGTITAGHAILQAIAGTEHATGYSLAANGASVVFTLKYQLGLFQVPLTGGVPSPTPNPNPPDTTVQLVGVSCKGTTCLYAKDDIAITATIDHDQSFTFAHFLFGPDPAAPGVMELHRISLTTGADELLGSSSAHVVFATPQISPTSGDVVVQTGGGWGHLQTFATASTGNLFATDGNSVLHLYRGLAP